MDVGSLHLDSVSPGAVAQWRDLAARAVEPNPYLEPGLVLPAATWLEPPESLHVVTAGRGDVLHAAVALTHGRRWRRAPITAARGWAHDYHFLGTPLIDRHEGIDALAAILRFLRDGTSTTFLALDQVALGGPFEDALRHVTEAERLPLVIEREHDRAFLTCGTDAPLPIDGMDGRHRRELNRLRRKLAEEVGGELTVVDRAGDRAAADTFLDLEASGWKGEAGTGTALRCRPGHDEFLRQLCTGFDPDRLRVLSLEHDGRSTAMLIVLRAGEGQFMFKWAFDDSLRKFSPGVGLMLDATRHFHDDAAYRWVDSCAAPDNQTINRLWTDRRRVASLLVGLRGRAQTLTMRTASQLATRRDRRQEVKAR